jgi:hypothetical protein
MAINPHSLPRLPAGTMPGMSEGRNKSGVWPWIVALLIGLPVLYVTSWGPVAWLVNQDWCPWCLHAAELYFYSPLRWALESGPSWLSDGLWWWIYLWADL